MFVIPVDSRARVGSRVGTHRMVQNRMSPLSAASQGLPKTRSGKIMRRILRKIISQEVWPIRRRLSLSLSPAPWARPCLLASLHVPILVLVEVKQLRYGNSP